MDEDALKAAVFKRLHSRVYLERFIAEKYRPDGREFTAWRDVSINVGSITTADGSSLVRMGDTVIVCGVKAEIAEPDLERPNEGFLVPNLDLPALCSPSYRHGPPSEDAQILSERLYDALILSEVLSLKDLCIASGKSTWVLYVDAVCINYDGNAFDAALLAMISALRNTKIPKATYDEDAKRTTCSREYSPLAVTRLPCSMTFGIFDHSHILCDPTAFEEKLVETTISVIVDERGNIIEGSQLGLGLKDGGDADALSACSVLAKRRRKELDALLS